MKVSRDWLSDFVKWQGADSALCDLLTRGGLTVEEVIRIGVQVEKVVVAQILESEPHPNADRLSVCRVADGSAHPRQIVCGAKNYRVGDKVPLALPGAVLPGNFQIKTGKLRGVESEGMMCSAKELGLGSDSQGLLILPPDAEVGESVSTLFPGDVVLDVEVTSNRPDWLSHLGVAREIAAISRVDLFWQKAVVPSLRADKETVWLEPGSACEYYTLRRIRNVKVGPSPAWLRRRLEAIGLRSINNIVDVTNYVMHELGQPLHAFDAKKTQGGIRVRRAMQGETFLTLDGASYALREGDTVIADAKEALALGGVVGGVNSGVTEQTTEVLLESALFTPSCVRRTARELGIHTDSSHRFERGVDPEMVELASARACQLIKDLCAGEPEEYCYYAGELAQRNTEVPFRYAQCRRLLGLEISDSEIDETLQSLGLKRVAVDDGKSTWSIPSWRLDLQREVDLVEEVIRVRGIECIAGRVEANPSQESEADRFYDFRQRLAEKLVGFGFCEARTSTLVSGQTVVSGFKPTKEIANPLGEEQRYLRASLVPGLLEATGRNFDLGAERVFLFEVGTVFEGENEVVKMAVIAAGDWLRGDWRGRKAQHFDFFDLKGVIEQIVGKELRYQPRECEGLALSVDLILAGAEERLGIGGILLPKIARSLDVRSQIIIAEIDLSVLFAQAKQKQSIYQEISKFPSVRRDLGIVISRDCPYSDIESAVLSLDETLLESIRPIDLFTDDSGEKLAADVKSIAISLIFRSKDRTLSADEVNATCDRIRAVLKTKLQAQFRE